MLGGLEGADHTTADISVFDPVAATVTPAGRLAAPAHDAAGGIIGGRALLVGGGNSTELDDVQAWSPLSPPSAASATIVGHLPRPRSDDSVASSGQALYVVGGYDGSAELPDVLATNDGTSFRVIAHLAVTVRYAAAAALGDTVVVFGGEHHGVAVDDIQQIDIATGTVRIVGHLPRPLAHESVVELGGALMLIGGADDGALQSTVYRVDPGQFTVTPIGALPAPTSDMAVAALGDKAYIFGGYVAQAGEGAVKTTAIRLLAFAS